MSDEKLVMGYWDCTTCGTKHIKGTVRDCPSCGQPRGEDIQFYMDSNNKEYLTNTETIDRFDDGPDWVCPACNALNNYNDKTCKGCGTLKGEAKDDYFSAQEKKSLSEPKQEQPIKNSKKVKIGIIVPIILMFIAGLCYLFTPKTVTIQVQSLHWTHNINIEKNKEIYENDWYLPTGARLDKTNTEIRCYDRVIDHYETKTYQERVQIGTKNVTKHRNNGNGTFTEYTVSEPVYDYVTKTKEEPVYKRVPVYDTKYYYYIYRWLSERNVTTQGDTKETFWGDTNLAYDEREGKRTTKYTVKALIKNKETKEFVVNYDLWLQFEPNKSYKVKLRFNDILSIEQN